MIFKIIISIQPQGAVGFLSRWRTKTDDTINKPAGRTMKRLNAPVGGLLAVAIISCGKLSPRDPSPNSKPAVEPAAVESAQAWLEFADGGSFGRGWEDTAAAFQAAITQADWEKAVRAIRATLRKPASRKIESRQSATFEW